MQTSDIKEIIVTVLLSGALFSFLQFLITRHDNKKNVKDELEKKMDEGFKKVTTKITGVSDKVEVVSNGLEEHKATLARTHILRFADELRNGTHSKEYFEQQLKDIDTYNDYCEKHKDFANGLTRMASEFIQKEYQRLYLSHTGADDDSA